MKLWKKTSSFTDSNSGLLLQLNHLLQKVPLVKWIKVIVVAIWRLKLLSLIPHLNQQKVKGSNCFGSLLKTSPCLVFDTEMLYVYPRLFPQFPFLWKHYWNKTASFEVLNRFKGEAWCVFFFHSGLLCIFCHRKKYIHFVITAQLKCPWVILNILNTKKLKYTQVVCIKTNMQKLTFVCWNLDIKQMLTYSIHDKKIKLYSTIPTVS